MIIAFYRSLFDNAPAADEGAAEGAAAGATGAAEGAATEATKPSLPWRKDGKGVSIII